MKHSFDDNLRQAFPDNDDRTKFGVDVNAVAKAYGRSPTSVRRWLNGTQQAPDDIARKASRRASRARTTAGAAQAERREREQARQLSVSTRNKFLHAFTGNKALNTDDHATPSEMLHTLFPSAKNPSGVDTKAAAAALGRAPSTVRRWISQKSKPKTDALKYLSNHVRKMATTAQGRAAALRASQTHLQNTGRNKVRIAVDALQGPPSKSPGMLQGAYVRKRTTVVDMDWNEYNKLVDAWARGGDQAAQQEILDHLERRGYPSDFSFAEINNIGIGTNDRPNNLTWS